MFKKVDVYQELKKSKQKKRITILDEVNQIFEKEKSQEIRILADLNSEPEPDSVSYDKLDASRVYNLEEIKQICIRYRLRFLTSDKFKGEIPFEAISEIKRLEKELDQPLSNFKIIAPKKLFRLEDKDSDPLLFLQLNKNQFYFIHKWGGELNQFRSLFAFPLRSFMHMFWFLAAVALTFSLLIPTSSTIIFIFLFVHSFIAICGIACMLVFSARENFSDVEWNSKFFS